MFDALAIEINDPGLCVPYEWVYLLKATVDPPRYKIGRTNNMPRRSRDIMRTSPFPTQLIGKIAIRSDIVSKWEKGLHEFYAEFRAYDEWFELPPEATRALVDAMWTDRHSVMLSSPF